jgi:hypothetical protein
MIKELEEMSNDSLLFEVKKLEAEFDAVKMTLLKNHDKLMDIKKKYETVNNIIAKRLNHVK